MEERTVLRVERRLFYFNAALLIVFISILRFWQLGVLNILLHFAAMWLTSAHPDLLQVYFRYRTQADYYRPWVSARGWLRNRRPDGFGRL